MMATTARTKTNGRAATRVVALPPKPTTKQIGKRTEGSYQLARLGITNRQIGEALDVEPSTVGRWITGEVRPPPRQRAAILARYGIQPAAWEVARVDALAPSETKARSDGAAKSLGEIYRDECWRTLEDIRLRRGDFERTTPDERLKMLTRCGDLYEQIAKTLDEREQLAMLIRLSAWRNLKATVLDALRAHPEAAAAVSEALHRAETGE